MSLDDSRTSTVLHRILWWLALIGLARGVADIVNLVMLFAVSRVRLTDPVLSSEWMAFGGSVGSQVWGLVLAVGAGGLLARKSWSWPVLTIWASVAIPLTLMTLVGEYGLVTRNTRVPATQATIYPYVSLYYTWNVLMRGPILGCSFPLLMLAVLWQREVRNMWSGRGRGGFEVIPMARVAQAGESRGASDSAGE